MIHLNMPLEQFERSSPIPEDEPLSHYIKLDHFKEMLLRKAMFFSLSTQLRKADPHEGVLPKRESVHLMEDTQRRFKYPREGSPKHTAMTDQLDATTTYIDNVCIKCFHRSAAEDTNMWNQYAPNGGVMIRTSFKRLKAAFNLAPENIFSAPVRYIDPERDIFFHPEHYPIPARNFLAPHIVKSREYQNEKEFRLMYLPNLSCSDWGSFWKARSPSTGIFIQLNPCLMMEEVIISPYSSDDDFSEMMEFIGSTCQWTVINRSNVVHRYHV